ncbi:MAG: sporulation protein [Acidobacteriota bacterium]|nr:sporulation protein [Acidobacteriota bacterium]
MDPQHILTSAQDALTARRVFGDPITVGDSIILPAAVVGGGGGGGGKGTDQAGLGFGMHARPAGVYVIKEGQATWRPAVDVNKIIMGGQLVAITALLTFGFRRWVESRHVGVPTR